MLKKLIFIFILTIYYDFAISQSLRPQPNRFVASTSLLFTTDSLSFFNSKQETLFDLEFRLGFQSQTRWYLGGLFYKSDRNQKKFDSQINLTIDSKYSMEYYGLSLGYNYYGLYLIANYIFNGNYSISDQGQTSYYKNGYGFQIDLGVHFALTDQFFVGPKISYKNHYLELDTTTDTVNDSVLKINEVKPYFVFWFEF